MKMKGIALIMCAMSVCIIQSCGSETTLTKGKEGKNTQIKQETKIKDIDKNEYSTVIIGKQEWMVENLNSSKFSNGDVIKEAKTEEEWIDAANAGEPAWCYYNNNSDNADKYGKLYNWWAVYDARGLAPKGYKIPENSDWSRLLDFLGGNSYSSLKGLDLWKSPGTNKSGFNALPGGFRYGEVDNNNANFYGSGTYCNFWSASDDVISGVSQKSTRYLGFVDDKTDVEYGEFEIEEKGFGFSVRCVRK